VIDTPW
jgi:ribonuclease HI